MWMEERGQGSRTRRDHRQSRERRRSRSRASCHLRSRSRGRDRNRRERSRSRDRRDKSRDRDRKIKHEEVTLPLKLQPGHIYDGKVTGLTQQGCFVQVEGLKERWEGFVHISHLRSSEIVRRDDKVMVKCLSFSEKETCLSIKDVDQKPGQDLNPFRTQDNSTVDKAADRNPDRHMSGLDEETGLSAKKERDSIEDVDIKMVKYLPPSEHQLDMSPIKIVENPDVSLSQSAMMKPDLQKQQAQEQETDQAPTDNSDLSDVVKKLRETVKQYAEKETCWLEKLEQLKLQCNDALNLGLTSDFDKLFHKLKSLRDIKAHELPLPEQIAEMVDVLVQYDQAKEDDWYQIVM